MNNNVKWPWSRVEEEAHDFIVLSTGYVPNKAAEGIDRI